MKVGMRRLPERSRNSKRRDWFRRFEAAPDQKKAKYSRCEGRTPYAEAMPNQKRGHGRDYVSTSSSCAPWCPMPIRERVWMKGQGGGTEEGGWEWHPFE